MKRKTRTPAPSTDRSFTHWLAAVCGTAQALTGADDCVTEEMPAVRPEDITGAPPRDRR
jgi:hypothetical protein